MAWKRSLKPVASPEWCLCQQCAPCGNKAEPALLRCYDCHYFIKHPSNVDLSLSVYCAGAGHEPCPDREAHKRRVAADTIAIKNMLRELDHSLEVAGERKWGQLTFEELT